MKSFCLFLIFLGFSANASENITLYHSNGVAIIDIELNDGDQIYWNHVGRLGKPTEIELENISNLNGYKIDWPWPEFKRLSEDVIEPVYKSRTKIPIYIIPVDRKLEVEYKLNMSYLKCGSDGCIPQKTSLVGKILNPKIFIREKLSCVDSYFKSGFYYFEVVSPSNEDRFAIFSNGKFYQPDFVEYSTMPKIVGFKKQDQAGSIEFFNSNDDSVENKKISDFREVIEARNLVYYLLFAFIGGFILNLMPCVLPVLSLKIYSLTNCNSSSQKRFDSVLTILTIIAYFMFIAFMTVSTRDIGHFFFPGLSMQIPSVIIACCLIVTIVVSVMQNQIYFVFPSFLSNPGETANKYLSVILTTIATTILATPCTAPYLVTSMTYAITQPDFIIYSIFLFSSLGFAGPYFIFLFLPQILNFLPKSGKWQKGLHYINLFLLISTLVWLLWILYGLIDFYASFTVLLLLYLFRFCLEAKARFTSKVIGLISIVAVTFYVPGNIYSNFKAYEIYKEGKWLVYDKEKVTELVNNNKIVFVTATADWCVTCQYNKAIILDTIKGIALFDKSNVTKFEADLTRPNEIATEFLKEHNSPGIPLNIIYGPTNKKGLILPVILDYKSIEDGISKVK